MESESVDVILDLEKPEEQLLEEIVNLLGDNQNKLKKEGQIALNFLVKKKGEKPKPIVYNLNKEQIEEAEKDYVFPKVVGEVIRREFNPNIAKNEKLLNHIMDELKKDPYWSDRVVKLIKSLKENDPK